MLGKLKDMKDGALSKALQHFIADRFSAYGELQDCQVDTRNARAEIRALLKGETTPITLCVDRYSVERRGGERYITLESISCSREWIALLLTRLYARKPLKLPAAAAALL
jgi:hypothetical protein